MYAFYMHQPLMAFSKSSWAFFFRFLDTIGRQCPIHGVLHGAYSASIEPHPWETQLL
jgi:hypothetical protein